MTSATENRQVLFIINKYSGTGYNPAVEGRLLSFCQEAGLEAHLEFTQGRGHATQLAYEASQSKKFDVVFAMGGDGTVNEVAKGLVHTQQVMGVIPKGSGNGLARHLGIPLDFKACLPYLASTHVVSMDSFTMNGHLSINVSGIGFDGHIAALFGKNGKRGLANYTKLVVHEFRKFGEFVGDIKVDTTFLHERAFMIAFANSSQFGNNARIAPYASVCDGELDITLVRKVPFFAAPAFALKMFSGNLGHSNSVKLVKGKTVHLTFETPLAYHVDGEAMEPERQFQVQINPASIRLLVPQDRTKNI